MGELKLYSRTKLPNKQAKYPERGVGILSSHLFTIRITLKRMGLLFSTWMTSGQPNLCPDLRWPHLDYVTQS
jgi:hypothetical protein